MQSTDCLPLAIAALLALTSLATVVAALDFSNAHWIWLPGPAPDGVTYPPGNATFRRDYYPPAGRTPLSANILITVDNAYTLWVNGREIGTSNDFRQAHRYCVPLEPDCNVFAIQGQNAPSGIPSSPNNPAGAISAIEIRYTDGFTEQVVTDAEWHGLGGPSPPGFQQVAYDDSAWPAAFVEGPFNISPWNAVPWLISIPPATQDPGPDLTKASYIWTNEVVGGNAPVGGRAFRKTITLPAGQLADSVVIDMSADNEYTLYVNGLLVGSGQSWTNAQRFQVNAQRFQVNFIPSNTVTIAVYANNDAGPAALIAAGALRGCACGCGSNAFFVTDSTWKYTTAVPAPAGFINPGFDDSKWAQAVVEGPYGQSPWGKVPIPTANSPQGAAIAGAPAAPPASVVS